jgi:hypothetical protein
MAGMAAHHLSVWESLEALRGFVSPAATWT